MNTNHSGPGSLRQLISAASAGETITFAPGLAGTINLTSGPIVINQSANIIGPGPQVIFLAGSDSTTILQFTGGNSFLSGLTITEGGDPSGDPAIAVSGANLTVSNCQVIASYLAGIQQNGNHLVLLNSSFIADNPALVVAPNASASATNCTFANGFGNLGSAISSGGR